MYNLFRFTITCAVLLGFAFAPALESKKLNVQLEGASQFTHYSQPLMVILENPNTLQSTYQLKAGQVVNTPDHQDLMVTQDFIAKVKGGATDTFYVPSMCIQEHMPAPRSGSMYTMAPKNQWLTKEAARLSKSELSRPDQQQLLWAMVSDFEYVPPYMNTSTLHELNGARAERGLSEYTPSEDQDFYETPNEPRDEVSNRRPNQRRVSSIKGYFEVDYSRSYMTHIGLFNEDNILVQVILEEQPVKGRKRVHYTFNPDDYRGQTLYARLIIEGQVELEREIRL